MKLIKSLINWTIGADSDEVLTLEIILTRLLYTAWKHRIVLVLRDIEDNTTVEMNAQKIYTKLHFRMETSIIYF